MEMTLEGLANYIQETRHALESKFHTDLLQESNKRWMEDQNLKQQLQALRADFQAAMQAIDEALDRLEAPPDKEQSPMLAEMADSIEALWDRVEALEKWQESVMQRL